MPERGRLPPAHTASMTAEAVIFITTGAVFAGFVNGLAGFGTSLFALGWWLQVMDPIDAVAVSLAISVLTGIQACGSSATPSSRGGSAST